MKLSLSSFLAITLMAGTTPANAKNIRGVATSANTHRGLKDDKDSDDGGNSESGVTLPPGMENSGSLTMMTNEETGQTYALILPSEEANEESGEDGLVERHACVSHQSALEFIAGYTVQNVEHEDACIQDPESCAGGCCRQGHQLTCDEDNAYPHLPCICNQNTKPVSAFEDTSNPATNTLVNANANVTAAATSNNTATAPSGFQNCVSHEYALEIVDVFGGRGASDQACLDSPLPASCSGCCRAGPSLVCDEDGDENTQNPCVCPN